MTATKGSSSFLFVGGIPGRLTYYVRNEEIEWKIYSQPVELFIVCEFENELIYYSINSDSSTNKFKLCICWVIEDEVFAVKIR